MLTILGQHISLIRPSLIHHHSSSKNGFLANKYNTRAKTNKECTGKVIAICIKLANGEIKSIPAPSTHIQVCEQLKLNIDHVVQTGWQLENGNYLWR